MLCNNTNDMTYFIRSIKFYLNMCGSMYLYTRYDIETMGNICYQTNRAPCSYKRSSKLMTEIIQSNGNCNKCFIIQRQVTKGRLCAYDKIHLKNIIFKPDIFYAS